MRIATKSLAALLLLVLTLSVSLGQAPPAAAAGADFTLVPQNVTPDGNGLLNDMTIDVRGGQVSASASGPGTWLDQTGPSTAEITGTYDPVTGMFVATYTGVHRNTREAGGIVQDVTFTFTGTANQKFDSSSGTVQISFNGTLTNEVTGGEFQPPVTTHDHAISVVYAIEGADAATGTGTSGTTAGGGTAVNTGSDSAPSSGGFPLGAVLIGIVVVGAAALGVGLLVKNLLGASGTAPAPLGADAAAGAAPAVIPVETEAEVAGEPAEDEEQEDEGEKVVLELTYPVGRSPKVFTVGWVFGARCVLVSAEGDEEDFSDSVEWSGSGEFEPDVGSRSHPSFANEGGNTIVLSCEVNGRTMRREYAVNAVSPANYASVGTWVNCPSDSHGCPTCPHVTNGQVNSGSEMVYVNGRPAARRGDGGNTTACCGAGTFVIAEGDPDVLIGGRPAARIGDRTDHCGGVGQLVNEVGGPVLREWGYMPSRSYWKDGVGYDEAAYEAAYQAALEASKRTGTRFTQMPPD